jgi:Putative effector of murein hydrolase
MEYLATFLFIVFTIAVYATSRWLFVKCNSHPALNIVGLSAAIVIIVLMLLGITFKEYTLAKDIMCILLGPATVALALPLYRYREILRKRAWPIINSVAVGSLVTMFSATLVCKWGGLPHEVVMSMLPKGVSIPFALEVSSMQGGIPSLATAFVVATGTLGSLLGGWMLTRMNMLTPIARGLAYGTVSHAQGTAAALLEGDQQGAMAGLAMILAGILTATISPIVVFILEFL